MGAIYLKFRNIPGQAKHMNYVRLAVVSGEWQGFSAGRRRAASNVGLAGR